jgi:hypothetical protein
MRSIVRRISMLPLLALLAGCGGAQQPKDEPRGTLRFKGEPGDALLEINETDLGPIRMFEKSGVLLRPGPQRIVVSKEGYFTDYRIVDVKVNTLQTVEVTLREMP